MLKQLVMGLILAVMVMAGSATFHHQVREPGMRDQAKSQLEVLIRKMEEPEGISPELVGQADPWGNQIIYEWQKGTFSDTLELRSAGPDGLPYTEDDIVATRKFSKSASMSQIIEKNAEALMRGLTKGSVGGVREGLREKPSTKKE